MNLPSALPGCFILFSRWGARSRMWVLAALLTSAFLPQLLRANPSHAGDPGTAVDPHTLRFIGELWDLEGSGVCAHAVLGWVYYDPATRADLLYAYGLQDWIFLLSDALAVSESLGWINGLGDPGWMHTHLWGWVHFDESYGGWIHTERFGWLWRVKSDNTLWMWSEASGWLGMPLDWKFNVWSVDQGRWLESYDLFAIGGGGEGGSGPQSVLVLGDSISGAVNYPGVPLWPDLLKDLRLDWTIHNWARSGETMSVGRAKAGPALATAKPDVLVIFYGSNNAIMGDMAGFESDLRATIRMVRSVGARVVVCTVPRMYGARAIYNGRVASLNVIIRSAAPAEGAVIADVAAEFGTSSGARFPDGLHPDLEGQRIIAVLVRDRI